MKAKSIFSHDPSWRFKSLSTVKSDKYISAYNKFRKTGKPDYIEECVEIYKDPMYRLFLESMLLADFSDEECVEFFGCDDRAIEYYRKIYFDIEPVKGSKAKMLSIANNSRPNEKNLKTCAVKFGKDFVKWFIGQDNVLSEDYEQNVKKRLSDGMLMKSLGHEFVGSTSDEMDRYMRMIGMGFKCSDSDGKKDTGKAVEKIVDHFSIIFNRD